MYRINYLYSNKIKYRKVFYINNLRLLIMNKSTNYIYKIK